MTTDDPHRQRTAMLSALLATITGLAASQTHGLVSTMCLIAAAVVALPAISTGGLALLALALTGLEGPAQSDGHGRRTEDVEWRKARRRRTRLVLLGLALVAGAGGATWYALSPGIESYTVGVPLMLPTLAILLIWLHRRLPPRLRWPLALVLAPIGPVGYLVFGGAQWWSWGQMTVLPLVLLAGRGAVSSDAGGAVRFRAFGDGPWGPP